MELHQQDAFPNLGEFFTRIRGSQLYGCVAGPQLCLSQQGFVSAVAMLRSMLSRQHSAVKLEIHFAAPNWQIVILGFGLAKELVCRTHLDFW